MDETYETITKENSRKCQLNDDYSYRQKIFKYFWNFSDVFPSNVEFILGDRVLVYVRQEES
jgi:hypothetical protein